MQGQERGRQPPRGNERERPSTVATLEAYLRTGQKEIAQVLPAFPQSVRVVEEPGTLGNPTPLEVYQEKHDIPRGRVAEREMGVYANELRSQNRDQQQTRDRGMER